MECSGNGCDTEKGPSRAVMVFRLAVLVTQAAVGMVGMLKGRSFRAMVLWLGGLFLFWTVPRYYLCARCSEYGKDCYSFYLGRAVSAYLPRSEGYEHEVPPPLAVALEVISIGMLCLMPLAGMKRQGKLLSLYLALAGTTLAAHFLHACAHCAVKGQGWKKNCPPARAYRRISGIPGESRG